MRPLLISIFATEDRSVGKKNKDVEVPAGKVRRKKDEGRDTKLYKDKRLWVVVLHGIPPYVVKARSEGGAWAVFKKKMGIRYSEHEPQIRSCGPDVEYDEDTGKVTNPGEMNLKEDKPEDLSTSDDDFDEDDYDE